MAAALRQLIVKIFRAEGLSISAAALKRLADVLQADVPAARFESVVRDVASMIDKDALRFCIVEESAVEALLSDLNKDDDERAAEEKSAFLSAFDCPRFAFDQAQHRFILDSQPASSSSSATASSSTPPTAITAQSRSSLFGEPSAQQYVFARRHRLLQQRLSRHELFRGGDDSGGGPAAAARRQQQLTPVEALVGSGGSVKWVLAVVRHVPGEGPALEDPSGTVPVEVDEARATAGCFSPGCFVVAQGVFTDGRFRVHNIGFPPAEHRRVTAAQFPRCDLFGLGPPAKHAELLADYERRQAGASIIVLSDVWLDVPDTFRHLQLLFKGFEEAPPEMFILAGNFTRRPIGHSPAALAAFKKYTAQLAALLLSFPAIAQQSYVVFVPGPDDPGAFASTLPRHPLPSVFVAELHARLPRFVSASNPCRIRYCTQSIVVFRADLVNKLRRTAVLPPDTTVAPLHDHAAKTLIDQANLLPFGLNMAPVYWNYEHALDLYPVPDVLVVADRYQPYHTVYEDCVVFNPSALCSGLSFYEYLPATRQPRQCQLPRQHK